MPPRRRNDIVPVLLISGTVGLVIIAAVVFLARSGSTSTGDGDTAQKELERLEKEEAELQREYERKLAEVYSLLASTTREETRKELEATKAKIEADYPKWIAEAKAATDAQRARINGARK